MNKKALFVGTYAFAHLVVDAACAFLMLNVLDSSQHLIVSLLIYNALAFVLQVPIGYMVDAFLQPKLAALFGLLLVASSFLCWNSLFPALILVGIGNALFHVGGGSLILSLEAKRATFSGLYVAPGGIGLVFGTFLSTTSINVHLLFFPLFLLLLCAALYFVQIPTFHRVKVIKKTSNWSLLIVVLILIPIIVRSLIGLSFDFPWKENPMLLWFLTAAVAGGKIVGGVLADRFGLLNVGVGGMLFAAPLLAFFHIIPLLGLLGVFLFNFTMPVTLIAIFSLMPNRKGLTFGLTTAALFIGALPVLLGKSALFQDDFTVYALLAASTLLLYVTLRFVENRKTTNP